MTRRALHVERRGRGPALMLLHGFTGTGRSLADLSAAFDREFETLAPDLPGHGASTGGARDGRYAFDDTLQDLVATLAAAGHQRAHWLGYSMGARLALGCAVRHPDRVASLVLIGGRPGIADPAERAARRRADDELAARIEAVGVEAFVDEWLAQPLFATQQGLDPAVRADQRRARLLHDPRELAASLRGRGRERNHRCSKTCRASTCRCCWSLARSTRASSQRRTRWPPACRRPRCVRSPQLATQRTSSSPRR